MPQRDLSHLSRDDLEKASRQASEPGYEWTEGRFGPPPGIPRRRKLELDAMTDQEYLYAVLRLDQEARESLMVSEAERRRTFRTHWPLGGISWEACAKTGLYYTGRADRVQCAFCAGIIKNWNPGDIPKVSHKNYFGYCKFVLGKPTDNIPYDENNELAMEIMQTKQLSTNPDNSDSRAVTMNDLGIVTTKPKLPSLSVYPNRMQQFEGFGKGCPISAERLCEAGFYWLGEGDKVKCFWCDGALEMWSENDDPWLEHAKWYPGCSFLIQTKGASFIRKARERLNAEDMATAENLDYNSGDLTFLQQAFVGYEPLPDHKKYKNYEYCMEMEYPEHLVERIYKSRGYKDIAVKEIVDKLHDLEDSDGFNSDNSGRNSPALVDDSAMDTSDTVNLEPVSISEMISNAGELSDYDSKKLVEAVTCLNCHKNMSGAVVLPCGCFCLCQDCSELGRLPKKCPRCTQPVKGSCRTFMC